MVRRSTPNPTGQTGTNGTAALEPTATTPKSQGKGIDPLNQSSSSTKSTDVDYTTLGGVSHAGQVVKITDQKGYTDKVRPTTPGNANSSQGIANIILGELGRGESLPRSSRLSSCAGTGEENEGIKHELNSPNRTIDHEYVPLQEHGVVESGIGIRSSMDQPLSRFGSSLGAIPQSGESESELTGSRSPTSHDNCIKPDEDEDMKDLVHGEEELQHEYQGRKSRGDRFFTRQNLPSPGEGSPFTNAQQLRASVSVFRKHLVSNTPNLARDELLTRLFDTGTSVIPGVKEEETEPELFVTPQATVNTILSDSVDEEKRSLREVSKETFEAFQLLKAAYEEKLATGRVLFKDKLAWQTIVSEYGRGFNKRKLDRVVDIEEIRSARKIEDFRRDGRKVIEDTNDYRQRHVRQDVESSRKRNNPSNDQDGLPTANTQKKKTGSRKSQFTKESWLAGEVSNLRGSIESAWNPERTTTVLSADDNVAAKSPGLGTSESAVNILSRGQILGASDEDDDAYLNPIFESEQNETALKRIITHCTEKAPKVSSGLENDRLIIKDAKQHFRWGNRPTKVAGEDRFKVARMRSTLTPYQVVGIGWMRWRELSSDEPRGGLLADSMGLGKTVQMLGVIMDGTPDRSSIKDGHRSTLIVCSASLVHQWEEEVYKHCLPKWYGKVTVYKATDFVRMSNEPLEMLKSHNIIITTYEEVMNSYPCADYPEHLKTKAEKQTWWEKHLVKNRGLLHQIHFHRFVIDECQRVKNCMSKGYEAVRALKATHRWLMSGTPVTDKTQEIFSYFKIIHRGFIGDLRTFKKNYLDPLNVDHEQRLNYSIRNFVYRRTNNDYFLGKPILELPQATQFRLNCTLSRFENAVYNAIAKRYFDLIEKTSKDKSKTFEHIFHMMMAFQQLNSHPLLVQKEFARLPEETLNDIQEIYERDATRSYKDHLEFMQGYYEISKDSGMGGRYGNFPPFEIYRKALEKDLEASKPILGCSWCADIPAVSQISPCNHVLCAACTSALRIDLESRSNSTCDTANCGIRVDEVGPLQYDESAQQLNNDHTYRQQHENSRMNRKNKKKNKKDTKGETKDKAPNFAGSWLKLGGVPMPSTKTIAVKLKVLEWFRKEPNVKIIIFTHYLGMISILKRLCEIERWNYIEFSGNVNPEQRRKNRKEFSDCKEACIMLATIKTGNTGLNLTAATKVIIIEPWWNESVDNQAFARVWRIGQERATECVRLFMRGTIDDRKMSISSKKTERIMKLAMKGGLNDLSSKELIRLFKPAETKEEEQNGGFVLVDDTQVLESIPEPGDTTEESSSEDSDSTEYDSNDSDESWNSKNN